MASVKITVRNERSVEKRKWNVYFALQMEAINERCQCFSPSQKGNKEFQLRLETKLKETSRQEERKY